MKSLQRSFIYTLIIYILLLALGYLSMQTVAIPNKPQKTKIDPAQFKMVKQKRLSVPKKEKTAQPQKKQQPVETQRPFVKVDPIERPPEKKPSKKLTPQKLPVIKKEPSITLPKRSDSLVSALLNSDLPKAVEHKKEPSREEKVLQELYGDELLKLSTVAKQYLNDNHLKMQMITQQVLNRIGHIYIEQGFSYYGYNLVEFMFYPDGSIGDIKLLKDAGFNLLDKVTKETIETAYKDYPRPTEPVLVRYKFLYDLRPF